MREWSVVSDQLLVLYEVKIGLPLRAYIKKNPESSRSFRVLVFYSFSIYAILLTALVRREIFLAAVFLW